MDLSKSKETPPDGATLLWSFLDLAPEIRTSIYQQLFLDQSLTVTANMKFDWPKVTARQNLCTLSNPRNASVAILLCCRQIYEEARPILYQCVDYVCVELMYPHSTTFNRFGYEQFDFARSHVRKLYGFPLDSVHGQWPALLFNGFPQLDIIGLEFDMVVPVVRIRDAGAKFPVMTEERLLNALDKFGKWRYLDPSLELIRERKPKMRVYVTLNFLVGHIDEDRQLHIMALVEVVALKIVKVIYRHEDCTFKHYGEWKGCHMRIAWPEVLDMLDGKNIDVGSFQNTSTGGTWLQISQR